jgi:thioredoxin-dependent peroxiredoxin
MRSLGWFAAGVSAWVLAAGCAGPDEPHAYKAFDHTGPGLPVTWSARQLKLEGESLKAGDPAPDVTFYDIGYQPAKLSSYRGKVVLISVVPELGTPVCDQTTRLLERAAPRLGKAIVVLTISDDTVWDQSRWCETNGVTTVRTLSDAQRREFGRAYGLQVAGRDVLMRAMLVVDREGVIRYLAVVDDMSHPPDISSALNKAKELAGEE